MAHGRYTVVRKLAEGGMAEIFLARQHGSEGFEKPVVLKRIHSAFYADEQFRNMLVDEAHISMSLHHNNIAQVLDLGRARGRLFLVLELVDGWDLARVLERAQRVGQAMPVGLGLYVMAEVCRALSYAHGRARSNGEPLGIVHRDVSPQNVLLSEQGEVKLTDFGIAKAMTRRDRTATGVVKGKIAFMSPEQALGRELDARSDLFSLGTMLYLASVGVRPFEAATDFEVIARVQKGLYLAPNKVKSDLPAALCRVITRVMSLDRERRYQTAEELLVDLEGIWRTEYGAPGQTELKLWLADLQRADGEAPIGRTTAVRQAVREESGDLEEGDALVLGDESASAYSAPMALAAGAELETGDLTGPGMAMAAGERSEELHGHGFDAVDALEDTSPARLMALSRKRRKKKGARVSGVEATTMADLSLPLGDESEEMLDRLRQRNRRRRMFSGGLVVALLVSGVAVAAVWRIPAVRDALTGGDEAVAPAPQPGTEMAAPEQPVDEVERPRAGADRTAGGRRPMVDRASERGRDPAGTPDRPAAALLREQEVAPPPVAAQPPPVAVPPTRPSRVRVSGKQAWQPPPIEVLVPDPEQEEAGADPSDPADPYPAYPSAPTGPKHPLPGEDEPLAPSGLDEPPPAEPSLEDPVLQEPAEVEPPPPSEEEPLAPTPSDPGPPGTQQQVPILPVN